jgi:hypothetical protein
MSTFEKKKHIVFLSSNYHPPFLSRYLSTKEEAENYLLSLQNVTATILKPGFIYSYR